MTAEELLGHATAEFEKTFEHVQMGNAARFFYVDDVPYEYVEVCSGGVKEEGASAACFDTAAEAVQSWQAALQPFKGKKSLYWRRKPEIEQDENKKNIATGGPNPTFGKWKVYSRFQVLD